MAATLTALDDFIHLIASCPWLWWLGVSAGLRAPHRRAADRSIVLKLLTVLVVPVLTAAGTYVSAWYGMRSSVAVLEERLTQYMKYNDDRDHERDARLRYLEEHMHK